MAERRLRSVEKKLKQDESLAQAYQSVIDDYKSKGYIREVPEEEPKPSSEWFLPHFPVVRPEKATTKVRIVFDGSAQQNGKSLNSESLPGPKLQSDIVDILLKFRKESFALVGDVTQMYHQLILRPVDRPLHRFLYRNLGCDESPRGVRISKVYFREDVIAHFAFNSFGKNMQKLIWRFTHWQLKQSWNTATWMTSCLQYPQLMKLNTEAAD